MLWEVDGVDKGSHLLINVPYNFSIALPAVFPNEKECLQDVPMSISTARPALRGFPLRREGSVARAPLPIYALPQALGWGASLWDPGRYVVYHRASKHSECSNVCLCHPHFGVLKKMVFIVVLCMISRHRAYCAVRTNVHVLCAVM